MKKETMQDIKDYLADGGTRGDLIKKIECSDKVPPAPTPPPPTTTRVIYECGLIGNSKIDTFVWVCLSISIVAAIIVFGVFSGRLT